MEREKDEIRVLGGKFEREDTQEKGGVGDVLRVLFGKRTTWSGEENKAFSISRSRLSRRLSTAARFRRIPVWGIGSEGACIVKGYEKASKASKRPSPFSR